MQFRIINLKMSLRSQRESMPEWNEHLGPKPDIRWCPAGKENPKVAHLLGRSPVPGHRFGPPPTWAGGSVLTALWWGWVAITWIIGLVVLLLLLFPHLSVLPGSPIFHPWMILSALVNTKKQEVSGWYLKSANVFVHMLPNFPSCRHRGWGFGELFHPVPSMLWFPMLSSLPPL